MAEKYCDHGAYGAASFTASSSTTTLTVSAVASGRLGVGALVTCTGVAADTYITALGTGTGGTGTYTISVSQTLSSRAMTSEYANPTPTPAWGVPQEGDGTSSTAATASAVASWDLSAATAAATATVSILGATLTCVASGATNNQFNAGTGTTLIDNLVTAINRAANTVVTVAQATGWETPKIQDAVFARRTGNNLEVMTRAGSATYNGLTAMTHVGLTGTVPANPTWSGGSGGCWRGVFNHRATIWPSAVAIGGYGIWGARRPIAGAMLDGDIVKVRANKTITLPTNTNVTWTMAAMGSVSLPVRFDIDTGVTWPADGSTPVFKITEAFTSNTSMNWLCAITTFAHIKGSKYASGQRNLVLEATGNGPSIPTISVGFVGAAIRIDYLDLYCPGTPTASPGPISSCSAQFKAVASAFQGSIFYGCRIVQPGQNKGSGYGMVLQGTNSPIKAHFIDCDFIVTAPQTAWTDGFGQFWASGSQNRIVFDSCRFTGFVTGSKLNSAAAPGSSPHAAFLRNCDLGGITLLGPYYLSSAYGDLGEAGLTGLYVSSQYGNREFFIERPGKMMVEWMAAKGRPTLNALLPDGITHWQIYAVTGTVAATGTRHSDVADIPLIKKLMPASGDLAEAPRTIKVNFLLESTLAWHKGSISAIVSYMAVDGTINVTDTYDADFSALDTSTAAWSSTSWNGQTWSKKELSVTTPLSVKEKTEVSVQIRLHEAVANDTLGVIIDPELVVT